MAQSMSDPARLYFLMMEDEAPLSVPGLNPSFTLTVIERLRACDGA